ncbi:MAG: UDP-glucose dehydrogenase family protein [Deltaproteobacteria bacterium]
MQKVAVIGAGYVGLVTASCLADLGNRVICVDNDRKKIESLKKGVIPIYEPGLKELVLKNKKAKRLSFIHSIAEATRSSDIIFIAVGTPPKADGGADLAAVEKVATEIARAMNGYKVIVGKSTVPAETGEQIKRTIGFNNPKGYEFDVVSNPEFLREGQAISDTFHPDRIVIGVESKRAEDTMRRLYSPIKAPILVTNIPTAEIIKHACNCFLATKISYINAVAHICERINADVEKVAEGMGMDKRIGRAFLNAGAGFGGYCFPKDLDAFIRMAEQKGYSFGLLKEVRQINAGQLQLIMKKIEDALWIIRDKTVGVLGLSFKPETDDIRNSIALEVVRALATAGARVKAYDPQAMEKAKQVMPGVKYCKNPYEAAKDSHCLVIMTEWKEFAGLDLKKVKSALNQPLVIDGRNMFDPAKLKKLGFDYRCVGRGCQKR